MKIKSQITKCKAINGKTEWQLYISYHYENPMDLRSPRVVDQTYAGFKTKAEAKEYAKFWKDFSSKKGNLAGD